MLQIKTSLQNSGYMYMPYMNRYIAGTAGESKFASWATLSFNTVDDPLLFTQEDCYSNKKCLGASVGGVHRYLVFLNDSGFSNRSKTNEDENAVEIRADKRIVYLNGTKKVVLKQGENPYKDLDYNPSGESLNFDPSKDILWVPESEMNYKDENSKPMQKNPNWHTPALNSTVTSTVTSVSTSTVTSTASPAVNSVSTSTVTKIVSNKIQISNEEACRICGNSQGPIDPHVPENLENLINNEVDKKLNAHHKVARHS